MKSVFRTLTASIMLMFFTWTPSVFAAGLVKCDEQNPMSCTLCALFATLKAVYDFATQLAIILAVGYILYGGYQMLIAGAKPELYKAGKSHILQAFVGLAIVLVAWFIVDILMRALTGAGDIYGAPWRTLQCK